jgi:transposase-like protein
MHCLWRAVDLNGDEIDIIVHKRKDKHGAKLFFQKVIKRPASRTNQESHYRIFRDRAFVEWGRARCVQNLA